MEAHVRYLDQVSPGEQLEARSWVIGASGKLLWIWHELYAGGTLRATEEILGVHVTGSRSSAFPDDVRATITEHLTDPPEHASRSIRVH